ncbi:MAG: hypothetical protein HS109_05315 [Burkholderiales bacterium]|nr:hypothetical protein [Burkholderiales bacterium]
MRTCAALALAVLAPAILGGCASRLSVYREGSVEPEKGLPFSVPEVYVKTGWHDRSAKADDAGCDDAQFFETVLLPTGDRHYLNVEAMPFTKTGFVVKFNASGNLSEVTLNTEPSGADEIKAVAELIKTVAPIAAGGAATRSPEGVRARKACDAGERDVRFCKLDEFRAGKCK